MNTRQAKAPDPIPFGREAFQDQPGTTVRWLGGAGALVNCRGTVLLIDPVLEGFDMPLLVESPLKVEDVPKVDAVLLTPQRQRPLQPGHLPGLTAGVRGLPRPPVCGGALPGAGPERRGA